jgi:hypothetical protein
MTILTCCVQYSHTVMFFWATKSELCTQLNVVGELCTQLNVVGELCTQLNVVGEWCTQLNVVVKGI